MWKITKEMNALLRRTISYHDYREDFYHAFLAGMALDITDKDAVEKVITEINPDQEERKEQPT